MVNKSRFIARLAYASKRDEALAQVAAAKTRYPDARHHCWAYVLGSSEEQCSAAMSDDGEPSGTAGKPILNVLQHKAIGNVVVVVSRYFGGIKLGAGGLVRAYSNASQQVTDQAIFETIVRKTYLQLVVDFSQEQALRHIVATQKGQIENMTYTTAVQVNIALPSDGLTEFLSLCDTRQWQYKVIKSE